MNQEIIKQLLENNPKWIHFNLVSKTDKTGTYDVIANEGNIVLGQIKWYSPWRKYSFFPNNNTLFEKTCLQDIINFIDKLMEERKSRIK